MIKKISKRLVDIQKAAISAELPLPHVETVTSRVIDEEEEEVDDEEVKEKEKEKKWKSVSAALEDELNEAGDKETRVLKEKQREMIDALDLRK